ncbi:MAG: FecR domain-containing protein [Chloroflexi bacterium]|nr:FecR domain-containing protein [Chloroflexota bacterium]
MRKLFTFTFILTLLIAACRPAATAGPAPTSVVAATAGATISPSTPLATTGGQTATATISEIKGTAEERLAVNVDWATAIIGQALATGNQVRTGSESLATIQFAQGTLARLGPEAVFTVSELGGDSQNPLIKLQLAAGQLFILITGSLGKGGVEVETPIGVAAVRGSLMSVEVTDDGRIIVTCLETTGNCQLENESGSVEIQSGQQAEIVSADEPPTPAEQIDDSQLNEWFQNNPEAQAIVLEDADADGYTILQGDCDDNDADIHPDLDDTPNDGLDQNCDGDDGVQPDEDGDGYTVFDGDCDDDNPKVNPGAADSVQDGLDVNCDGFDGIDEELYDGDYDDDGLADAGDNCPDVYNPDQSDSDGNKVGDVCDAGEAADIIGDTDGDGLPDTFDLCPDQFGAADLAGCPDEVEVKDSDGDGLGDDVDLCPFDAGPAENSGCPATGNTTNDQDGDGVTDDVDQCPDKFGDAAHDGCPPPDSDGDGLADDVDQCPFDFGSTENGGCPGSGGNTDSDGDGIPDDSDQCPTQFGDSAHRGCPDNSGGDQDGDGISDDKDQCPDKFGDAAHDGCPPPDSDGDGVTDDADCAPFDASIYPGANDPFGDDVDQNCDGFDGGVRNPRIILAHSNLFKHQVSPKALGV